jgi:hypothetical protein
VGKRRHDDFSRLNRADLSAGGGTGRWPGWNTR